MGGRAGIWDLAGTYWWLWVGDAQTKMPFLALAVCRAAPPNCHPFCCTPLHVLRACTGQGTGGLLWADGVQGHQAPREKKWGCPICTTALCAPDPLSRTCVLSASSCIQRSPAASQPTDNGVWGQEMRSTPLWAAWSSPAGSPSTPHCAHCIARVYTCMCEHRAQVGSTGTTSAKCSWGAAFPALEQPTENKSLYSWQCGCTLLLVWDSGCRPVGPSL